MTGYHAEPLWGREWNRGKNLERDVVRQIFRAVGWIFLIVITLFSGTDTVRAEGASPGGVTFGDTAFLHAKFGATEVRGTWIATVTNLDWPSRPGLSDAQQQAEAVGILDAAQEMGIHLVVFQVRPTGDAFYASDFFPWSKYLTGVQGTAPEYDPLQFWIDESHRRGIMLHAWINPYRISMTGAFRDTETGEWKADLSVFCDDHPARKHSEWVVPYADGKLYFNPGIPAVRQYIIDAAMEIVERYDVDGIHFDDYFYPYPKNDEAGKRIEFGDAAVFAKYGSPSGSIHDWRRENVNELLHELHERIRAFGGDDGDKDKTDTDRNHGDVHRRRVVFGVSPFAIWRNHGSDPRGSETNGLASCDAIYADSLAWVERGYVDYIVPQIYWAFETKAAPYEKVADWWVTLCRRYPSVVLIIGMGAHRIGSGEADDPWRDPTQFVRQLDYNAAHADVIRGRILFGWKQFSKNPLGCVDELKRRHPHTATLRDGQPLSMNVHTLNKTTE